jgi:hypothetical protein
LRPPGFSESGVLVLQLTKIPFYKRGCQEKHFGGDWKGSRHPALRCNEAL